MTETKKKAATKKSAAKKSATKTTEPEELSDPRLTNLQSALKKETLLGLFVSNQRRMNKAGSQITEAWTKFESTVNEDNIDLYIAEEQLKAVIADNRAALGYQPAQISQVLERELTKVKQETVEPTI